MTEPSHILSTIFDGIEPPDCRACSGQGLVGIHGPDAPTLCLECGGSGYGSVLSPDPAADHRQLRLELDDDETAGEFDGDIPDANFLARFRKPMTDAEMDEAADAFGRALMAGLDEIEDELQGG